MIMFPNGQKRAAVSTTLLHVISTSSHFVLKSMISVGLISVFFYKLWMCSPQGECWGMPDFHVKPDKAPIVHLGL